MPNWTEKDYQDHLNKKRKGMDKPVKLPPRAKMGGSGPKMNKTETRFANDILGLWLITNEITRWEFEPFKFRAMESKFYKPDFAAWFPDESVTVYEVKAYNLHRSSLDRFQACREKYDTNWLRFQCWQWANKEWSQIL